MTRDEALRLAPFPPMPHGMRDEKYLSLYLAAHNLLTWAQFCAAEGIRFNPDRPETTLIQQSLELLGPDAPVAYRVLTKETAASDA